MPRIFITVAEASADQHASHLVTALRALDPSITIDALGGPRLRASGATVHHDTVTRAAMGFRAALRALEVHRLLRWTRDFYAQHKPDLHICCDSWSMNVHFAKLAKQHNVPVLYYIAPQTWGSRESRVHKMRDLIDHLACIWPFEEPYFRKHGIAATYVGHPLFDALPADRQPKPLLPPGSPPTVAILPGSRKSIAAHNFPRQLDVARQILSQFPKTRFLVPTTTATHATVTRLAQHFPNLTLHPDAFDHVIPQCDLAISVSGTATLHAAAYGCPLIVVYYGSPILWHAIGRWLVKTTSFSMVNLLSGQPTNIAPEFIPWYGPTQPVADLALSYLRDPTQLESQRAALHRVIRTLDRPGASHNAAELALSLVSRNAPFQNT